MDLYELGTTSTLTEVLFMERCLRLLKKGGRMGMVLPEGVLNTSNLAKVREWFEGRAKIIKLPKPVLDEVEKDYLSYVIKPFRNRIKYFYKWACADCDTEIIMVACKDNSLSVFPPFKKNAMYKGMIPNKKYTLDDLGL